jgi:PIN domain nuclease of toxin-antitoxin system
VQERIEKSDLLVSPAVALELQYLFEIKRVAEPARFVVDTLTKELGLKVCDLPFPAVSEVAFSQSWTRDPFDRLIVSQAVLRNAPLLTRDRTIRAHCSLARWDMELKSTGEAQPPRGLLPRSTVT